MKDYEEEIAIELKAMQLSFQEVCRQVDMAKLLAQWPTVRVKRVDKLVQVELPGDESWERWVYNPGDGLLRNERGEALDKIGFFARLTGLPYNEAALALATDESVQRDGEAATWDTPVEPGPTFTLEDLDRLLPDITWLWQPWLPRGFVTLLVGEPGVGKSGLALAIANLVASGEPWPDGQENEEAGLVVWVESESAEAILRERATKWNLPKACLLLPSVSDDPLEKVWLDEEEGWNAVVREAYRPGVRLLVLDSLRGAYHGDENASDTIDLLNRLAALARDTQIAVLVVHHLRKRGMFDNHKINLDRVRGSSAIVQIPRCVWALDRPDSLMPNCVRLQMIKNNLARFPDPIGFEISETGVTWKAAPSEPKPTSQREKAVDLLRTLLRHGPLPASEIYFEAEGAGISRGTLRAAKEALGVVAKREGGRGGKWYWGLPTKEVGDN